MVLPDNEVTMFDYWKPLLTDVLIDAVKADGGVLLNLASNEMKRLFDWRKVARAVKVISHEFYVSKDGKLKTVVVYAKMCRGAMARYAVTNRVDGADGLKAFAFEGFSYSEAENKDNSPVFIL